MSSAELFAFAKIPLNDFEQCLAFLDARPGLDLGAAAEKMLWQTLKTFERLVKQTNNSNSNSHANLNSFSLGSSRDGDLNDQQRRVVQRFANQCVRAFALLDYGRDCGYGNLMRYLHK